VQEEVKRTILEVSKVGESSCKPAKEEDIKGNCCAKQIGEFVPLWFLPLWAE
jgi:hypothetical protein